MIPLHPTPDAEHLCPYCDVEMQVEGWYIPGMRNLVRTLCPICGRAYYGDLPAGQGLYSPMLVEVDSGVVHDRVGVPWFADWLRDSFARRSEARLDFQVEQTKTMERAVLLNCLDRLYGHCLLKLLNAEHYLDNSPDFGLIALVPRFLRWLVPEGVAAIWTVDLPLDQGTQWNDWLAGEVRRRIEEFQECWLSVALSHPHPEDYTIDRFTRVTPFPVEEWVSRLERPTVTFVWRDDRTWHCAPTGSLLDARREQTQRVLSLAQELRSESPRLDFAIAGLGEAGGLPDFIADMRTRDISRKIERDWCKRYARSHVIVGVHGSNMLLPSAHAGAAVELMPPERWRNLVQDILPRTEDLRETLYRYRFLPLNTTPTIVAQIVSTLLHQLPRAAVLLNKPWRGHELAERDAWSTVRRYEDTVNQLAALETAGETGPSKNLSPRGGGHRTMTTNGSPPPEAESTRDHNVPSQDT